MKKLLFALFIGLLFTGFACNKSEDQLSATTAQPKSQPIPVPTLADFQQAPILPDAPLEKSPLVTIINQETRTLGPDQYYGFFILRESLGDPLIKKHQVNLVNLLPNRLGNPNLYVFAYDSQTQMARFLRQSTLPATQEDFVSFRSSDLTSSEDRIYVVAYSHSANHTIKLITSIKPVDCVEYPVAEPRLIAHGSIVIGCNGVQYPNFSYAFAAGVTSWRPLIVQ